MRLRHLRLPGLTSYRHAAEVQDGLVARQLKHKADPSRFPPPDPIVITAEFDPVYTCGRREIGTVSAQQIRFLTQPTPWGNATFSEALRGGQTTFHGPGQLIAYPILDLKRHRLSPRCYVRLLETTVIELLWRHHGIQATTTDNPGVWISDDEKVCALGVHLRRNVSSHGIGLNVSTDLGWFDRIVACGLEGKRTTSVEQVLGTETGAGVQEAGWRLVEIMAERLEGVTDVVDFDQSEIN